MKIPKVSVSASQKDGVVTVSMCNVSLQSDEEIELNIDGGQFLSAHGELVTASHMTDHNTFDAPDTVKSQELSVNLDGAKLKLTLPKMSAAVVTLK